MTARDRAWRRRQAEKAQQKRTRRQKRKRRLVPEDPEAIAAALCGASVEEAIARWEEMEEAGETQG